MSNRTQIVRVYPIRTTKKEWNIPLYCYHKCTERCSKIYVRDETDLSQIRYILADNPEYVNEECPRNSKLEKTFIRLHSFDIENPMGGTGSLYNPDMIVIPDTCFSVRLSYPLSYPVDVSIRSQTSDGFTLNELLYAIKMLYWYIYEEEERTATPRTYHIKKLCPECSEKKTYDYVTEVKNDTKNMECSICFAEYTDNTKIGQLNCNHVFHKQCILKWLDTASTCPLCRSRIIQCDNCNGTGCILYDYNGIVIPIEHRGDILNRNTTNGIFGIFGYDLEDLVVEHIHYNRIEKLLSVCISS